MDEATARRERLLAACGVLTQFMIGGELVRVTAKPARGLVTSPDCCWIRGVALGGRWLAGMSRRRLGFFAQALEPGLEASDLNAEQMDELAGDLAQSVATAILPPDALRSFDLERAAEVELAEDQNRWGFTLHCSGVTLDVQLSADSHLAEAIDAAVRAAPRASDPMDVLPVTVRVLAGSYPISLADLGSLAVGDAILPTHLPPAADRCLAIIGNSVSCWCRMEETGARIMAKKSKPAREDDPFALDVSTESADPIVDGAVQDAEITMIFEAGRTTIRVGDLPNLGIGYVFSLAARPPGEVDMLVGGRRVGQARIVDVDGAAGFLITSIDSRRL